MASGGRYTAAPGLVLHQHHCCSWLFAIARFMLALTVRQSPNRARARLMCTMPRQLLTCPVLAFPSCLRSGCTACRCLSYRPPALVHLAVDFGVTGTRDDTKHCWLLVYASCRPTCGVSLKRSVSCESLICVIRRCRSTLALIQVARTRCRCPWCSG